MRLYKGYYVGTGYMGYIGKGHYMLFATESEYEGYVEDEE